MKKLIVAALLLSLPAMSEPSRAQTSTGVETALEVDLWCKTVTDAPMNPDGTISLPQTLESRFCWGAFAAIQQLSVLATSGIPLLRICAPATSTRVQYIRVFRRYVEQHPETANDAFGWIAQTALARAFPCNPN